MQLEGIHCTITIEPHRPRLLTLRLVGSDVGEFGAAPMRHLEALLPEQDRCELFIDARDVRGASIDVSSDWAQWLKAHRDRFGRISMLTSSRFVRLTAEFVRQFADLGTIMRIYSNARAFDDAFRAAEAQTDRAKPGTPS